MNTNDIVEHVAQVTGSTKKQAKVAVDAVFDAVSQGLTLDGNVRVNNFGTFALVETKARDFKNPQTGETVAKPAGRRLKFSVASALKALIK